MAASSYSAYKGFVRQYMECLLQKAQEFTNGHFVEVSCFYRNKSAEYFEEIRKNGNIIYPMLKDRGGDERSPINGRLKGVFFCVTLYRGGLPTISPYGNTRLHVPIEALFDETSNLYFADFYCFGWNIHYIILVLTKTGTDADNFCQENLLLLDPHCNEFLTRNSNGESTFYAAAKQTLHLEVFYADEVNIGSLQRLYGSGKVFLAKTRVIGQEQRTQGSTRKCKLCQTCNLQDLVLEKCLVEKEYEAYEEEQEEENVEEKGGETKENRDEDENVENPKNGTDMSKCEANETCEDDNNRGVDRDEKYKGYKENYEKEECCDNTTWAGYEEDEYYEDEHLEEYQNDYEYEEGCEETTEVGYEEDEYSEDGELDEDQNDYENEEGCDDTTEVGYEEDEYSEDEDLEEYQSDYEHEEGCEDTTGALYEEDDDDDDWRWYESSEKDEDEDEDEDEDYENEEENEEDDADMCIVA